MRTGLAGIELDCNAGVIASRNGIPTAAPTPRRKVLLASLFPTIIVLPSPSVYLSLFLILRRAFAGTGDYAQFRKPRAGNDCRKLLLFVQSLPVSFYHIVRVRARVHR